MLNLARPEHFLLDPSIFIEKLLMTALFAKIHCNRPELAIIFTTYIKHNFKDIVARHEKEIDEFTQKEGDQANWLKFVHPEDKEDENRKSIENDSLIGL